MTDEDDRPGRERVADALEIVLEFSRARDAGRPNVFEFSPQTYLLRGADGGVETAELPWSQELLEDLRATQHPGHAPDVDHRIGDVLRTFLASAGWSHHERAILAATREGTPVFLTIRSAAAELYALPWEFVAVKATGQLLGSIPELLLRYEWPDAPTFPDRVDPAQRRGRVLVAWSAAGGAVPADKLVATLRAAFGAHPGAFDPDRDVVAHATASAIARALDQAAAAGPPIDALHILCHGAAIGSTNGLALDDESAPGRAASVDASRLQQLLAPHAGMLRLVVLAACDSGNVGPPGNHLGSAAQRIHRAGVHAVIASRHPLSTAGAVDFASAFYGALVDERSSLERAFLAGRDLLLRNSTEIDWASIQLYARHADGHASAPLHLPRRPSAPGLHLTTPTSDRTARPALALAAVIGLAATALVTRQLVADTPPSTPTPASTDAPAAPRPPADPPSPTSAAPAPAPDAVETVETVDAVAAALAARTGELAARLHALEQRESKDRSDKCNTSNDFEYSKLTVSLAVDEHGGVHATRLAAVKLNKLQRECILRAIEAEVFTSPGEPFTMDPFTLIFD